MLKLKIFVGIILILIFLSIVFSIIRLKPDYVIFGWIGCEPELFEVTNKQIRIDTCDEVNNRLRDVSLYDLKGICHKDLKSNDSNDYKLRIPLIMLFDLRRYIGDPNSTGRYIYVEFKLFGIVRQFIISEPKKIIYFKDLDKRFYEKELLLSKQFDKSCFKNKVILDCY